MDRNAAKILINSLIEATDSGAVKWQTTNSDTLFELKFPEGRARVWQYTDPETDETGFGFGLSNSSEKQVLRLFESDDYLVEKLYNSVLPNALDADKTISGLINFLSKK